MARPSAPTWILMEPTHLKTRTRWSSCIRFCVVTHPLLRLSRKKLNESFNDQRCFLFFTSHRCAPCWWGSDSVSVILLYSANRIIVLRQSSQVHYLEITVLLLVPCVSEILYSNPPMWWSEVSSAPLVRSSDYLCRFSSLVKSYRATRLGCWHSHTPSLFQTGMKITTHDPRHITFVHSSYIR